MRSTPLGGWNFRFHIKDSKWGRKCSFINCTSCNGSPQQIPFQFTNGKVPHSRCRAFWAVKYVCSRYYLAYYRKMTNMIKPLIAGLCKKVSFLVYLVQFEIDIKLKSILIKFVILYHLFLNYHGFLMYWRKRQTDHSYHMDNLSSDLNYSFIIISIYH